jgi:hypothetical protein
MPLAAHSCHLFVLVDDDAFEVVPRDNILMFLGLCQTLLKQGELPIPITHDLTGLMESNECSEELIGSKKQQSSKTLQMKAVCPAMID